MYKCKHCFKEFDNKWKLGGHVSRCYKNPIKEEIRLKKIEKSKDKTKTCKHCEKIFDNGWKLGGHVTNCDKNPRKEEIQKEKKLKLSISGKNRITSEETKKKISEGRIKYLKENPDKVPYLLNHSSTISYPEKVVMKYLEEYNVKGWIHQMQISLYQLDFAFPEYKLDVEIDGHTHQSEKVKIIDERRDAFLISEGWRILRFTTDDVRNSVYDCINIILDTLGEKLIEIPQEFLTKKYLKEEKIRLKKGKEIKNDILLNTNIEKIKKLIIESNVNFSKRGWVNELSKIIGITTQKVGYWMKNNMLEFYEKNCTKRKDKNTLYLIKKECLKCKKIFETKNNTFCSNSCSSSYNFSNLSKNTINVIDEKGNSFRINKDDKRLETGELKYIHKDKIWIHNLELKKGKMIKKEELNSYLELGWIKGRKIF